ncbi:MAG: bifunctional hydroxymethylpyrimidine kinase/phosphomethylpyrimidine kinase [Alphaproteobacteria bacterium]|nr:bifunctional hydroxymethylpyrimidine kinase/phosphomethylpyrimidine kinase [Alphaproteobacteria bacterium]
MPSIACFGAVNLDRTARCLGELVLRTSNPVAVRQAAGGVARNVATNLGRLGQDVGLASVVGADAGGEELIRGLQADGIDTSGTMRRDDEATASYTAVLDRDGELLIGLADMAIYDGLAPESLRASDAPAQEDAWFVDANLPDACIDRLTTIASGHTLLTASTVSTPKAVRLAPYLARLDVLFANRAEAAALSGANIETDDDALKAADWLRRAGVGTVFITLGPHGAVATSEQARIALPAIPGAARDVVGAGDAFAAGALAALLAKKTLRDVLISGLATASITVEVDGPTDPHLSPARVADRAQHMLVA